MKAFSIWKMCFTVSYRSKYRLWAIRSAMIEWTTYNGEQKIKNNKLIKCLLVMLLKLSRDVPSDFVTLLSECCNPCKKTNRHIYIVTNYNFALFPYTRRWHSTNQISIFPSLSQTFSWSVCMSTKPWQGLFRSGWTGKIRENQKTLSSY